MRPNGDGSTRQGRPQCGGSVIVIPSGRRRRTPVSLWRDGDGACSARGSSSDGTRADRSGMAGMCSFPCNLGCFIRGQQLWNGIATRPRPSSTLFRPRPRFWVDRPWVVERGMDPVSGYYVLDGIVGEDGRPGCECNTCFQGPDCSVRTPDCTANADE